jgi:hypothetical protein
VQPIFIFIYSPSKVKPIIPAAARSKFEYLSGLDTLFTGVNGSAAYAKKLRQARTAYAKKLRAAK